MHRARRRVRVLYPQAIRAHQGRRVLPCRELAAADWLQGEESCREPLPGLCRELLPLALLFPGTLCHPGWLSEIAHSHIPCWHPA